MSNVSTDTKSIGDHLKTFAPYGATANTVGASIGVIVAHIYSLPAEVAVAVSALSAFAVNALMVIGVKLLERL